jgi:hypothetical protein
MTGSAFPPADFGGGILPLHTEPAGSIWRRIYASTHPDPLGHAPTLSRFSDPTGSRFGIVYLGSSTKVAFAEVLVRDRGEARIEPTRIPLAELEAYTCADIRLAANLNLVDLTGDGRLKLRVPSDVVGARDQTLARVWSEAFFDHSARADGILYPSRLNGERNIALYDRAVAKLTPMAASRLVERRAELADIIRDFALAII